ncbi:uncharacterized protein C1orf131 homolog isoform X2 [Brachionichthys hirsutus]|uniref:uncharacterized protein C1orf131 homolog isoform X2 n=1 Tax=Brachionichthys hirsutus TaxID=412623 RepID=UPI003605016F
MNSDTTKEANEDCQFLERVLDQLYDFGNGPASKKKKSQKKKRKRPTGDEEEEEELCPVKDACRGTEDRADLIGPEQTGPAIQQGDQVEVVTFHDPRKKLKAKQSSQVNKVSAPQMTEKKKESEDLEELNLEKARLEVHRFGITGYKKEQQRVFEQDRAIMLGARPPKKGCVNYKILQQQIKEKKQKAKEEVQPDLKKKKQNNQRDKKKKVSSGASSAPTGQVGRFKNGVLILNPKDIQKIKGNKRGK